jgi:hypothetical protein
MTGHYHIELENGHCINEVCLDIALAKAQARKSPPIEVGYVCVFGCGMLHTLTDTEKQAVKAVFPGFKPLKKVKPL